MMASLQNISLKKRIKNLMAINLTKGGNINLSKTNPGLNRVRVGLGWDTNRYDTGGEFDLDASVFVCKNDAAGNPKLISESHFVFYNNTSDPEGGVTHKGDNRTGAGAGDDETIIVDLQRVNAATQEISFIVTIHEADTRRQNFGQVSNSYIAIYNDETGEELAKYRLEDDFATMTAVQFGSLYKRDSGEWVFKAVGAGFEKGLGDFVGLYQ